MKQTLKATAAIFGIVAAVVFAGILLDTAIQTAENVILTIIQ